MRVPYTSPAQTRRRFEPAGGTYHIVAVHAEEVVGFVELLTYPEAPRHRHVAEASLVVTRSDWQGRGVGRSLMSAIVELADHWLNIERLSLVAFTENHHAIRLYEDLGFVIEGTMPSYGFGEGRWMDAYMMGRLRPKPVQPTLPV
jgi:putative acetyltransferase